MDRRALGRLLPLLAVAALLLGGVTAAALSSPTVTRVPVPATRTPQQVDVRPVGNGADRGVGADVPDSQLPSWLDGAVAGLCLAFVAVIVGMLVWYMFRDRLRVRSAPLLPQSDTPAPTRTEEVVAALDAGLDRLGDRDVDPRRAVIACWVRLEEAAATAGTPRHPGDTPTDLVSRLLAAHQVSRPVLDEFAAVYRQARYATHAVDERMRTAAMTSLRHLRSELTVREEVG